MFIIIIIIVILLAIDIIDSVYILALLHPVYYKR